MHQGKIGLGSSDNYFIKFVKALMFPGIIKEVKRYNLLTWDFFFVKFTIKSSICCQSLQLACAYIIFDSGHQRCVFISLYLSFEYRLNWKEMLRSGFPEPLPKGDFVFTKPENVAWLKSRFCACTSLSCFSISCLRFVTDRTNVETMWGAMCCVKRVILTTKGLCRSLVPITTAAYCSLHV